MIAIITTEDKGHEKKKNQKKEGYSSMVWAYSLGCSDGWSNRCIGCGEDNSYVQLRMDFRRKADTLGKVCLSP